MPTFSSRFILRHNSRNRRQEMCSLFHNQTNDMAPMPFAECDRTRIKRYHLQQPAIMLEGCIINCDKESIRIDEAADNCVANFNTPKQYNSPNANSRTPLDPPFKWSKGYEVIENRFHSFSSVSLCI